LRGLSFKALAIRNRAPVALSRRSRPTHWLGYTNKVHLCLRHATRTWTQGKLFETHEGGFCLSSCGF